MPIPLTVYGGDDCDDTEHVVGRLREWGVPYREVILEHDPDAERFVIFINGGFRSTPTLVFGDGRLKTILTEPTDEELAEALDRAGYVIATTDGQPPTANDWPTDLLNTDH
jgi:mycoredoxin